jgi:translocon-associated protein subunit alpha
LIVARCQSDSDVDVTEAVEEVGDLGIVGEDVQDFGDGSFSPAPGVDTIYVFPKNSARGIVSSILCIKVSCVFMEMPVYNSIPFLLVVVSAGEETELLVGIKNDGE